MNLNLINIIETFGYPVVFLGIFIESLGIPLPGETVLLIASAYAANSQLNIVAIIVIAAFGAILGDTLGFWIGKEWGRKILQKHRNFFHFSEERQEKIETYFHKYGPFTVFFGRFISILRTYSAFFAGVNKLHYPIFLIFNSLGGIIWAVAIGLLGYFFGNNIAFIEKIIRDFGYILLVIILIFIFLLIINKKEKKD